MKNKKVTGTSTTPEGPPDPHREFPPYFCCIIPNQLKNQAKGYRNGREMANSQLAADRYCTVDEEKVGSAYAVDSITWRSPLGSPSSLSFAAAKVCGWCNVCTVTQSPSAGVSLIHTVPHDAEVSRVGSANFVDGHTRASREVSTSSNGLKDIHISARLMEDFLQLASDNTCKDLETCGVLGAFLKEGTFYVTSLIIPKQETTSSSCQALKEEEIHALQSEQPHCPVGWIHTHPSQSCFMSSVDLHTQYSYQVMVPEAIAIVMAPTDKTRSYGIFRLTEPGGMSILRDCQEKGFHTHSEPADGSSIYEHCSNVYVNPHLRLEIHDLR